MFMAFVLQTIFSPRFYLSRYYQRFNCDKKIHSKRALIKLLFTTIMQFCIACNLHHTVSAARQFRVEKSFTMRAQCCKNILEKFIFQGLYCSLDPSHASLSKFTKEVSKTRRRRRHFLLPPSHIHSKKMMMMMVVVKKQKWKKKVSKKNYVAFIQDLCTEREEEEKESIMRKKN